MGATPPIVNPACSLTNAAPALPIGSPISATTRASLTRLAPLVVDKWLALQAGARGASTLQQVKRLMQHPAFSIKNPNKVRSLIGTFCHGNPAGYHAADGSGYAFWAEQVTALDAINPQVAARLARAAAQWKRLEPARRARLRAALEGIAARPGLSKDTFEVVRTSLA